MNYREMLLETTEALKPFERRELEDWLRMLKEDCELFGATAEDTARIRAIRQRLALDAAKVKP